MKALLCGRKAILKPANPIFQTCTLEGFCQRVLSLSLHYESELLHIVVRVFDDNPDLITLKHVDILGLNRKPHRSGITQITEGSYCPDKKALGLSRENNKDGDKNPREASCRPEPALCPAGPHFPGRVDSLDVSLGFLNQLLQKPFGDSALGVI